MIILENIQSCFVSNNETLVDVIRILENSSFGIALVINESNRLVGTFTDGDVRRAILNGSSLSSPVMNHMNKDFKFISNNQNSSKLTN